MRRRHIFLLSATLAFVASTVGAQSGDLSGVTMRVLDDVSDIDAVILELDASGGEGERSRGDGADSADSDTAEPAEAAEQRAEPREREDLHDPDDDERSEGKLEDNDVERPAVPPAP